MSQTQLCQHALPALVCLVQVERLMAELEEQDAQLGRRQDMLMSTLQRCTAAEAEAEMLRGRAAGDQQTITELKEAWWASAEDYRCITSQTLEIPKAKPSSLLRS